MPTARRIAHLLRRAGFGGTKSQIATLSDQPLTTTVDDLLDLSAAPDATRPDFLTGHLEDWEKRYKLQQWWLNRMRTTTHPLQEKMTFFWHGHFATSNSKFGDMMLMWRQQDLFRRHCLGGFRDLVQQMSIQPAMLHYLDNDENLAGAPNENFARELMELFTLGVNKYSQADVVASARAWTGHNTLDDAPRVYHFYADRHDGGRKTFMGETRRWDGPDIIDYLLSENTKKKRTAARFMANKLWGYFAYPDPEEEVLAPLVDEFYDSDLSIRRLVRAIFLRDEFYSRRARNGLVRSPVEFVVAALRATRLSAVETDPQWWMPHMGQQLFDPPNVAGWKQNAYWVSVTGMWARADWARHVTWKSYQNGFLANTQSMTVPGAIREAFDAFGIDDPSPTTRDHLESWLRAQRSDATAWRDLQRVNLTTLMLLTPDFNLA